MRLATKCGIVATRLKPLEIIAILAFETSTTEQVHIDIRIIAVGFAWPTNRDEYTIDIAAIDQNMAIAVIFGKGGNIASAH